MSASPRVPNVIGEQNFPFLSNKETSITAKASGTQATATALTAQVNRIDTCATTADSVSLPKIRAVPGRLGSVGSIVFVGNNGAAAAQVFGATPDTINGVATATGVAVAAGVNVWFVAVDYTVSTGVGTWLMTNSQAAAVAAITSGTIAGVTITNSSITSTQPAPGTMADTATIASADILKKIIVGTPTGAANYTLPLGTDLDAAGTFATNEAIEWSIINVATTATMIITMVANTGHTYVGSIGIAANASTTGVLYGSSAIFKTRKTAANTFVTYRIS